MFKSLAITRELDHTIKSLKSKMRPKEVDSPFITGPSRCYITNEPLGVVSIIGSSWSPLITTLQPLISAIAAGNVAIIKPSDKRPWSSQWLEDFIGKYLDPESYICVQGRKQVALRATSLKVDKIVYTGSQKNGKLVA